MSHHARTKTQTHCPLTITALHQKVNACELHCVYLDVPKEVCLARAKERVGHALKPQMAAMVISSWAKKACPPSVTEKGFSSLTLTSRLIHLARTSSEADILSEIFASRRPASLIVDLK